MDCGCVLGYFSRLVSLSNDIHVRHWFCLGSHILVEGLMSLYVVDVEADGPIPGDYSMLQFAAVKVEGGLRDALLSAKLKTLPQASLKLDAIEAIGYTRESWRHDHFNNGHDPKEQMLEFEKWIERTTHGRPIFISDNNGFDWMFIAWYFHHFLGRNPFGYSSRRLGDLYCGLVKDMRAPWKHLRKTKHTHNPLDDAKGNAEALLHMITNMGLR